LDSGTEITLVTLLQYRTYGGLLEGLPTHGVNRDLIAGAMSIARSSYFRFKNPHLIPPIETPINVPKEKWILDDEDWRPAKLPAIVCVGKFKSYQPVRDPNESYSIAVIVWFQAEFAMPIDPAVLDQIRGLNWKTVAIDATD